MIPTQYLKLKPYWLAIFLAVAMLPRDCFAIDTSDLPLIGDKFPFEITVTGANSMASMLERELRQQRKNNRQLKQLSRIEKIARFESDLLTQRLHAEGYYDAEVAFTLQGKRITYHVNSAAPYFIQSITLDLPEGVSVPRETLGIATHTAITAQAVLNANTAVRHHIASSYCLREVATDYQVVLETATQAAHISFNVQPSPSVNFGEIRFSGLDSIDEDYLLARLPIAQGECFQRSKLDTARVSLVKSNLLANITAELGKVENGEVPVTLHAKERRHRTVSAGLNFQTDNGFGATFGWEHRNLRRRAQRLKLSSELGETQQNLQLDLTLPHFQRNNQRITLFGEISREDTDAFLSNATELGGEISRPLWQQLRGSLGAELSFSKVEDSEGARSFALFSLPLSLEYDRRNDALDPTEGWVAASRFRPYWEAYEETHFVKTTLAVSAYHNFAKLRWQPTIAVRSALGTIDGADREDVAADLRFYVGGGGSVRGYPFQSLGPLDVDNNTPVGGLSFSDYSVETRFRWGESWGAVVFLDGGFAYQDRSPRVGEDLRWGTGLGLRYFTSFAPIRFDVAFPLNRRENIDDAFQLYISIGQAF